MLTLMGDESTIPWRVLSIDFLVQDKETGGDLLTDTRKFVCCWFFPFLQEVFLWVLQLPWFSISSPQKSAFLNSRWIQNTIDKEAIHSDNNGNNGNNNNNINNDSNNNMSLEKFKSPRKSNPL